jgi:hypothetical protein
MEQHGAGSVEPFDYAPFESRFVPEGTFLIY